MDAIVYTSNTGTTRQYAQLLSRATGLPVYPLAEAGDLPQGTEIFYLGWLKAGAIQGYKKAAKQYKIKGVCGVGLSDSEKQKASVRAQNRLGDLPFFLLMGGYDRAKLKGMDGFLMDRMTKFMEKNAADPDQNRMLILLKNGGSLVSRENLTPILTWWATQEKNARDL